MSRPCPICGKADGNCGDQPLAFPPITSITERGAKVADTKIYVPKQKTRRGVAGYKGKNVVVIDPDTGKEDRAATSKANKAAND